MLSNRLRQRVSLQNSFKNIMMNSKRTIHGSAIKAKPITQKKVAVIGAGPCGLATAAAFRAAERKGELIPQIDIFEKTDNIGGQWNFNWRTGLDKNGENVHSSMYHHLWTNAPKECYELPVYTFKDHFKEKASFCSYPPREVFYEYVAGRAKYNNAHEWIQFNTVARNLSYEAKSNQFELTTFDHKKKAY